MASTVLSSQPVLFNGASQGFSKGHVQLPSKRLLQCECAQPRHWDTDPGAWNTGSLWSQQGASKTPLLTWCRLKQQIRNLKTGWLLSISVKNTMKGNTKKEESWRDRNLSSTHKSEVAQNWQGPTLFSKPPLTAVWRWNNALEEGKSKQQHDFGHFTENLLRKRTQI